MRAVRTPFQRDRDRIVHSKPFRRLKGKTQVFIDPQGDHYRTRITHTLETTAISRIVGGLRLDEDIVEAIGLGHDTGHAPFGHAGEDAARRGAPCPRFGRRLPSSGNGIGSRGSLNLTHEVCDGVLTHTGSVGSPRRSRGRSLVSSTALRTSTTTSTTRCGMDCCTTQTCHVPEISLLGWTGSEADRHARSRHRRDLRE